MFGVMVNDPADDNTMQRFDISEKGFSHWMTSGHFLDVGIKKCIEPNGGIVDVSPKR